MGETSREHLRQALVAALGSEDRVKAYLKWALNKVGPQDLLRPENLRRFKATTAQAAPSSSSPSGGTTTIARKGLYPKAYRCIFDGTSFTAMKIKTAMSGEETAAGAEDEERELRTLLFSVQVCPQCFFASADKNHFAFDSPDPDKDDLVPTTRQVQLLQDRYNERQAIAGPCGKTLFTDDRSLEDALASYRLAAMCAQALYEGDPKRDPNLQRAMGRYSLHAAHLSQRLNDAAGAQELRRQALAQFREAYSALQGPAAYETLYVLIKLSSETDDTAAVHQYGVEARRLFDGRNQITDGKELGALNKHLKKINAVYEEYFQKRGEEKHIMNW